MCMKIDLVSSDKKRYLNLLLMADEQESMIDRYLEHGNLFVMHYGQAMGEAVAVAVVTDEGNGICELKNLAVLPSLQRKGYGRKMVDFLCKRYCADYIKMIVGTGESQKTISFYKSCGFSYSHTVPDFFVKNYNHPIVEDGYVLKDMIYFCRPLTSLCVFAKHQRNNSLVSSLMTVWEASVRASHHFLTDSDINGLIPFVDYAVRSIDTLVVISRGDIPVAFMGIDGQKIEMLFVSPCYFSQGLGSQLINIAIREYHVCYVDVNEQNTKALGFYLNLGFRVFERKETDGQGNPFPILKMKLVADNV